MVNQKISAKQLYRNGRTRNKRETSFVRLEGMQTAKFNSRVIEAAEILFKPFIESGCIKDFKKFANEFGAMFPYGSREWDYYYDHRFQQNRTAAKNAWDLFTSRRATIVAWLMRVESNEKALGLLQENEDNMSELFSELHEYRRYMCELAFPEEIAKSKYAVQFSLASFLLNLLDNFNADDKFMKSLEDSCSDDYTLNVRLLLSTNEDYVPPVNELNVIPIQSEDKTEDDDAVIDEIVTQEVVKKERKAEKAKQQNKK